jgi:hypothetical protein
MKMSVSQLMALDKTLAAHNPILEIDQVICPDQTAPPIGSAFHGFPNTTDYQGSAYLWAYLANSNPDGKATIQLVVSVAAGPQRGLKIGPISPDELDGALVKLNLGTVSVPLS